ncbi:MAG TPA: ABC transporter permease [Candidatus Nanopelagicales bacterium]|nr:ABC transporter permease [Candidatus Nanopelagicales bacterium]
MTTPSTAAGGLAPAPGAAPRARILLAQTATEVRMTLRNGEQLLLTLVIPLVLLVVLAKLPADVVGHAPAIDAVAPGVLALAVMSTAFTGQAIATGFERRYGVLRLLGSTPLGRSGLLLAKTAAVLVVEVVQVLLIAALAYALGWHPVGSWTYAAVLLVLGTAAFSALGLLLAGTLRAEATLAVANGLYLLLLAVGGVVIPADRLPGPLAAIVPLLPSAALGQGLRDVLLHGLALPLGACAVLVLWAVVAGVATARTFRWS